MCRCSPMTFCLSRSTAPRGWARALWRRCSKSEPEWRFTAHEKYMLSRDPRYQEDRLVVSSAHDAGSYDGRFAPGDSTGVPAEESEGGGELAKLLRIVRKRKGTILVGAFLGALAGLLIELPRTPVYRATVSLAVEAQND